jgi:threonine/homoserine/homoserine lactone efflux protein
MIFFKGFLVGLVLSAPMGPIGILCIRRILLNGRITGFFSILGISFADLIYASMAGFGIAYLSEIIIEELEVIQILGSVVLVLVGLAVIKKRLPEQPKQRSIQSLLEAFSSTFFLTLAHPLPIFIFTATFAALGVRGWQYDTISSAVLVAGIFSGSATWAPILVGVAGLINYRRFVVDHTLINRISGALIACCGICWGVWTVFHIGSHPGL